MVMRYRTIIHIFLDVIIPGVTITFYTSCITTRIITDAIQFFEWSDSSRMALFVLCQNALDVLGNQAAVNIVVNGDNANDMHRHWRRHFPKQMTNNHKDLMFPSI